MNNSVKFITCIYSDLYGTKHGGRQNRYHHYRWSLLSILKISNASFVCYTSEYEYPELCNFFYEENNVLKSQLTIKVFDLNNTPFNKLLSDFRNDELTKSSDRCLEIQYMKFIWFLSENGDFDYYYWIDSGLSHCGIIPNKYLSLEGVHNRGYYESTLFNNKFLNNLVKFSEDKFVVIGKENDRNFWSGTVNPIHFNVYDRSIHIIGGLFGGKKDLWFSIVELFKQYLEKVTTFDKKLYHEEDILTLIFRNHNELFKMLYFEIWWHEDEKITSPEMENLINNNRSFYKIIEELNNE